MDGLKSKFKKLLQQPGGAKFSGTGHRLGSAEPTTTTANGGASSSGSSRPPQGAAARRLEPQPQRKPQTTASSSSRTPPQQQQQQAEQELLPATEFSPFTAVIGGGAARTAHMLEPARAAQGDDAPPRPGHCNSSSNAAAGAAVPAADQQQQQPTAASDRVAVTPAHTEELQHCVALVASQGAAGVGSMQVLSKLLTNLLSSPQDAKYRQLRLGPEPNPKIRSAVLEVAGALDLLQACGFEVHEDEAEGGPGSRFAAFLDDARLSLADAGLLQLQLALTVQQQQHVGSSSGTSSGAVQGQPPAGSSSSGSTQAAAAAASCAAPAPAAAAVVPRDTRVLLPAAPDTEVPDWFFERTTADVKAEYMHLRRQRASNEVFSSKAWKESSASSKMQPAVITLRVRFPEGVCLQGCFGIREPLSAVHEWVTACLRQPGATYTLVGPDRKPLSLTGTVRDTGFVGAVLLLFRAGCPAPVDSSGCQLSWLSDEQLQQARVD